MKSNQIKLLSVLAKEIRQEKKDKASVIATLQSAKILTKHGNFTAKFIHLNRVAAISK